MATTGPARRGLALGATLVGTIVVVAAVGIGATRLGARLPGATDTPLPAPTETPAATSTAPTVRMALAPTATRPALVIVAPSPTTPAPTPTATLTPSPTYTWTPSPTPTPTATATLTPTPTATPTASPTPTLLPTATRTPVAVQDLVALLPVDTPVAPAPGVDEQAFLAEAAEIGQGYAVAGAALLAQIDAFDANPRIVVNRDWLQPSRLHIDSLRGLNAAIAAMTPPPVYAAAWEQMRGTAATFAVAADQMETAISGLDRVAFGEARNALNAGRASLAEALAALGL
jgi:hypothetical protein